MIFYFNLAVRNGGMDILCFLFTIKPLFLSYLHARVSNVHLFGIDTPFQHPNRIANSFVHQSHAPVFESEAQPDGYFNSTPPIPYSAVQSAVCLYLEYLFVISINIYVCERTAPPNSPWRASLVKIRFMQAEIPQRVKVNAESRCGPST